MKTFIQYLEGQEYKDTKKQIVDSIVNSITNSIKTLFNRAKNEDIDLSKVNSITFMNDPRAFSAEKVSLPQKGDVPNNFANIKINLGLSDDVDFPDLVKVELRANDSLINSARHIDAEYKINNSTQEDQLIIQTFIPRLRDLQFLTSLRSGLFSSFVHELKHFNQEISGDADSEGDMEYLTHPDEVEAWVNQFYHTSRKKKDKSLNQYITDFVKGAARQYKLSPEDQKEVIELYTQYANRMGYRLDKPWELSPSKAHKTSHNLKYIAGILMTSPSDGFKKEVIDKMGDVNYQDKDGNTLLHYITYSNAGNKLDAANWLIRNYKPNKNIVNNNGEPAFNGELKDKNRQGLINRIMNRRNI